MLDQKTTPEMPRLQPGTFMKINRMRYQDPVSAFQEILRRRNSYREARSGIHELMFLSHGASYAAGWWHDKDTGDLLDQAYQVPIKMALIHSEVSEAMEADRKGLPDDKLPHRPGIEVELADVLHRVFDLAGALGLDLAGAYVEKAKFNADRADHKVENRQAVGGKAY